MTYKIDNLTVDELAVAEQAVEEVRRKKRDQEEHQEVLNSLKTVWSDGQPCIYVVQQNTDLTEGRGGYTDKGSFIDRNIALQASALLPGVFGTKNDAPIRREKIYLTLAEWREVMLDGL